MAAGGGLNGPDPDISIGVPLLPGEPIQEPPDLYERLQNALSNLREQWMELSGFRKDPATGDWATRGGPRPEGVAEYLTSLS
jgi:hypothetical protein